VALRRKRKKAATIRDEKSGTPEPAATSCDMPIVVKESFLANALSPDAPFTGSWLRELAGKGYLIKLGHGKWDLVRSFQGYLRFTRDTQVKAIAEATPERADYDFERARKLKLENDTSEHLLIETPDAIATVDYIVGELITELAGIPARVSEDVAVRRRVEHEIDQVRNALAARFAKAAAALEAGRDPFADDGENLPGRMGAP